MCAVYAARDKYMVPSHTREHCIILTTFSSSYGDFCLGAWCPISVMRIKASQLMVLVCALLRTLLQFKTAHLPRSSRSDAKRANNLAAFSLQQKARSTALCSSGPIFGDAYKFVFENPNSNVGLALLQARMARPFTEQCKIYFSYAITKVSHLKSCTASSYRAAILAYFTTQQLLL